MKAHLELMSKPRLIAIAKQEAMRAEAEKRAAAYWRRYVDRLINTDNRHTTSHLDTLRAAQKLLDKIGPDPDAENHRDVLERELEAFSPTKRNGPTPMPGPRCARPRCNQRLNEHGLCTRCEHSQTKRARKKAAA